MTDGFLLQLGIDFFLQIHLLICLSYVSSNTPFERKRLISKANNLFYSGGVKLFIDSGFGRWETNTGLAPWGVFADGEAHELIVTSMLPGIDIQVVTSSNSTVSK